MNGISRLMHLIIYLCTGHGLKSSIFDAPDARKDGWRAKWSEHFVSLALTLRARYRREHAAER